MSVPERLFVPHEKLSQWVEEGKVTLSDNVLTLLAEKRSYELTEAVRFIRVEGGDPDPHSLLGKVRTKDQLKQMKAEHYMESVIIGDVAYVVQQGFVGANKSGATQPPRPVAAPAPRSITRPPMPQAVPAPVPEASQPAAQSIAAALGGVASTDDSRQRTDAELLTEFLLKNLLG